LEHPALSHIESILSDAYRKEIDQEENVWRSLPFFAATLALELAALFQLITRLPPLETKAGWASLALLTLAGLLMFAALMPGCHLRCAGTISLHIAGAAVATICGRPDPGGAGA
jgi:hypothetical protein